MLLLAKRRRLAAPAPEWTPLGLIEALDHFNDGPWVGMAEQGVEGRQVIQPELALFVSE